LVSGVIIPPMATAEIRELAQRYLAEHPFDALHSVAHHAKVWENCQWIVGQERLEVDLVTLEIAAWWHDVERGSEEHSLLRQGLTNLGIEPEFIEKIVGIINGHSYGQEQTSLEGKVLYDADKLEYLSLERVDTLVTAFKNGAIPQDRFDYYKKGWAKRIPNVRGKINFESTRKKFEEELVIFMEHAQKEPLLAEMLSPVI
jgi:HD superfamily phosphodiesterase